MPRQLTLLIILMVSLNTSTLAQTTKLKAPLNQTTTNALYYFKQVEGQQFDEYLTRIRPSPLAPDLKARVLRMLLGTELITPSPDQLVKLNTLQSVLKYHERERIIEVRVLRAPTATAVFLAGAAVLITEPAMKLLTAKELDAVVAHELGHEYYWNQFEFARQRRDYSEVQELELRCDGIAVVTLQHLGIDPECLITAIEKLNAYNKANTSSSLNYVSFSERALFIRLFAQLVRLNAAGIERGSRRETTQVAVSAISI